MRKILIGLLVVVAALAGVLWYFSEPGIPRAVLEKKYATGASQFIVLPDHARAHFRDAGPRDGKVLLLIHGSNSSLLTWVPWANRLDHDFRVVSVDMPGHGLTGAVPNEDYSQEGMVKFTLEFADKLGLAKFALGGNSMGGGVAARFAEEHPDRVTQLILVDAGGLPLKMGEHTPLAFRLGRTPVVNQLLLFITPRAIVKEGLEKAIIHKEIINDAMIDWYWDFARMEGTRAATLKRFNIPYDSAVKDHLGEIKMPTLILWGEEDGLVPLANGHAYHDGIAGSKLIVYPKTGHIPMEEVPDRSAADVRAFLNGTPPSP